MYEYLVTTFNVLAALITSNLLVSIALFGLAIFIIWIVLQLAFSFQRKFYVKSFKLYNLIKNNENNTECLEIVDKNAEPISSGFARGWKRFRNSNKNKPSDCITRYESLDQDINSGFLNSGKSLMKSYIWLVTIILFIFNLAYIDSQQTSSVIGALALSLVLPAITYVVLKIFYFTYTSIRQQLYKSDVEGFCDLIDLLDQKFGVNEIVETRPAQNIVVEQTAVQVSDETELTSEAAEDAANSLDVTEQENKEVSEETAEETKVQEPAKKIKTIDDYDVFKKKNIDVDKIINEIPNSEKRNSSIPYINVDSNYVIGDDDRQENKKLDETSLNDMLDAKPVIAEESDELETKQNAKETAETVEPVVNVQEVTKNEDNTSDGPEDEEYLEDDDILYEILDGDDSEYIEPDEEDLSENLNNYSYQNEVAQEEKLSRTIEQNAPNESSEASSDGKSEHTLSKEEKMSAILDIIKGFKFSKDERNGETQNEPVEKTNAVSLNNNEAKSTYYDEVKPSTDKVENLVKTNNEPEKIISKKQDSKTETVPQIKKSRGRPKNQVDINSLEITNDKEFNDVLARAEKLMRKSEQGLSQSQSKRIENELKLLIEAMNKYRGK